MQIITFVQLIVLLGIFLGAFARLLIPAIRKYQAVLNQRGVWYWDHVYTSMFFFSILVSLVATLLALPGFPLPENPDSLTVTTLLAIAFGYGWGQTALIIEIKEWAFPDS